MVGSHASKVQTSTTEILILSTFSDTSISASSTGTAIVVVAPEAGNAKILFPVTGTDQHTFSGELPGTFTNICLGFLGLGLILNGVARRFEK